MAKAEAAHKLTFLERERILSAVPMKASKAGPPYPQRQLPTDNCGPKI